MRKQKYKPGPGWIFYQGTAVWEHTSGVRVHIHGLIRFATGKMLPIPDNEFSKYRRICNGSYKRAAMAWATDNIL